MQREIKFRGKMVNGSGWVYGYYWKDNTNGKHKITVDLSDDNFLCHEVIPESVGQYTGLKDCKENRIYEGDVLRYKPAIPKHEGKFFDNVVEFAMGQSLCGWRMRNKGTVVRATPYKFGSSEVIGNIHDTPSKQN